MAYLPVFLVGISMENYAILAIFMGIDILTGVVKSYHVQGPKSLTSYAMKVGVLSKSCLLLIPVIIAWAGKGVDLDLLWFARGSLAMLILAETYSIIGNIYAINRREEKGEFDAVSFVLKRIRDGIGDIIIKEKK